MSVRSGLHPAGNDIPRLAVRNEMPTVASGHWLWPSNSAIDFSESRDRPPRTSDTKSIAVHAGPDQALIRKTAAKYFRLFFATHLEYSLSMEPVYFDGPMFIAATDVSSVSPAKITLAL